MEWSFSYTFYIDKLPCRELPSSKAGFPWQAHMSSVLPVSQFSEMYRCFILLMEKNKTPPQKKRKQKPPNFLLHLKLSWNHFRFSAVPVNYLLSSWQVLGCFFFFFQQINFWFANWFHFCTTFTIISDQRDEGGRRAAWLRIPHVTGRR